MNGFTAPNVKTYGIFSEVGSDVNVLVGGSPGSGKSMFVDGITYNLVNAFTPDDVELYLIDPKIVQLRKWVCLPHVKQYACTVDEAKIAMDRIISRMMKRYEAMARREIEKYTGSAIYLIIDELADLILEDRKGIQDRLYKIMRLGRAANIHVICCSQSVSRLTLPAVLQVCITCRVGLHTADAIDSRQIIKAKGCEDLPRFGKCYINSPDGVRMCDVPMYSQRHIDAMRRYWMAQKGR